MKAIFHFAILVCLCLSFSSLEAVQPKKKKVVPEFKWVNPSNFKHNHLHHKTFVSPSMSLEVGYHIYLPPSYESNSQKRFPVIYYLHGGRPGSESKSIKLVPLMHDAMSTGQVAEMIYVFVNGGKVSHYNMPKLGSMGEDIFVKELIPHIDSSYRTIAKREGRGIEGFSQGGRGTTRIMFEHPQLFISCAPGGSGYETEKKISESGGYENEKLFFGPGYNTWDRAKKYAKTKSPTLNIMFHVGTAGFNYQNNLAYMKFMDELSIPYQKVIVPDAPHSAMKIYEKEGLTLMKFHANNFIQK
jgi:endo-1,4-beta-xylanase